MASLPLHYYCTTIHPPYYLIIALDIKYVFFLHCPSPLFVCRMLSTQHHSSTAPPTLKPRSKHFEGGESYHQQPGSSSDTTVTTPSASTNIIHSPLTNSPQTLGFGSSAMWKRGHGLAQKTVVGSSSSTDGLPPFSRLVHYTFTCFEPFSDCSL